MKNMSFLFSFIIFFMYIEINANAQSKPLEPTQINALDDNQVLLSMRKKDKAEKDSIQQKKRVIVIEKGQLDQLKGQLDQLKNLQIPDVPDVPDVTLLGYGGLMGGSKDLSELRLMKSFKGESAETTKKFSVSSDYTSLNFNLSGTVESGVISVTLIKPNGKKFKSIEIDPTSDVSFTQGIDLKKDPKEWTGDWQIKIQAEKADGSYRLTILTR